MRDRYFICVIQIWEDRGPKLNEIVTLHREGMSAQFKWLWYYFIEYPGYPFHFGYFREIEFPSSLEAELENLLANPIEIFTV
jgi:hypothetical protein